MSEQTLQSPSSLELTRSEQSELSEDAETKFRQK